MAGHSGGHPADCDAGVPGELLGPKLQALPPGFLLDGPQYVSNIKGARGLAWLPLTAAAAAAPGPSLRAAPPTIRRQLPPDRLQRRHGVIPPRLSAQALPTAASAAAALTTARSTRIPAASPSSVRGCGFCFTTCRRGPTACTVCHHASRYPPASHRSPCSGCRELLEGVHRQAAFTQCGAFQPRRCIDLAIGGALLVKDLGRQAQERAVLLAQGLIGRKAAHLSGSSGAGSRYSTPAGRG